ncbi:MAG TPA: hypothetical protein VKY19_09005 [Ktedonosporobacter sp.]|nr:hypothetical protein [Ktedonosporobacter sp.]
MVHLLRPFGKKLLLRLTLLACIMALLGLVLGGAGRIAHATSMQAQTLANPVGIWNIQVYFLDCSFKGQTESGQLEMNASGAVVSISPYEGGGAWIPTGATTFDYDFTELIIVNGQLSAFVQVTQTGQVTSSTTYTSSGSGSSYDSHGNFLETCDTQTTATLA